MQGWIKLHRSIMKSETFTKLNAMQKLLAIYIILNANHEDGTWRDNYKNIEVDVKRGQLVVSRNKIANDWFGGDKEVTEQKIRTALSKMQKIGFLTMYSTSNYTLLEVLNYEVYQQREQVDNRQGNQVSTKSQPSVNQEITTNKNVKNDENVEEGKEETIPRRKYIYDDMHKGMAEFFVERIRTFLPSFKQPNMQRWANDFRMMNKIDKRSREEIGVMIKFVTAHHFWHKNCMSPSAMREKWDRLQVEMNSQKGGQQHGQGQHAPQRSEQDSIARGVIGHLNPNAHIIDVSDDELPDL